MNYTVIYTEEKDGGFTTQVVELPWCISYWTDLDDAQAMTKEAILAYLESVKKHEKQSLKDRSYHTFISNMFVDDCIHA